MPTRLTGAARWFTETQLAGPTREVETNLTVQTTTTSIVGNNGDRVALVIVNTGSFDLFVQLSPTGAPTTGIKVSAQGGFLTLKLRDDYSLITRQFFGISSGGATAVTAYEVIADIILQVEQTP